MGQGSPTREAILAVLADGKPKSHRDIVRETGLSQAAVWSALLRLWRRGTVLRTREPICESEKVFRGRAGLVWILRPYHLYLLKPDAKERMIVGGHEFVGFSEEYLDARGGGGESKAKLILNFIRSNRHRAWFSKEIAEALKDKGVKQRDVMSNVRRYERAGLVYVRGYRTEERETPFKEGYLVTWIDQTKPREQALSEAIERTNSALEKNRVSSPFVQRVQMVRDIIVESSKLGELVGITYIQNKLGCSEDEAEGAIARALQLYPDLKEVKLFNVYRYFYHSGMDEKKLNAAVKMKENYIRVLKGRDNRVGHNWEAVPEWFIDRFTTGARFWTQEHRSKMDPRRITIHLVKSVGGRVSSAEIDRVWEVTPGVFANPVTYVLSCKWGLVNKKDVDDFLEVLRWSKEFGVDTPDGRQVRQGVIGIFAACSFNPKESVQLKGGARVSLAAYANRMNIQLLKAADFNQKLHERGCSNTVTVQKICKIARDEDEVRMVLDKIWEDPKKAEEILGGVAEKNAELYKFERMLEEPMTNQPN
jgi:hypothetical protein